MTYQKPLTAAEAVEQALSEEMGCAPIALRAIELYESSRKRVQLTPEQEKAFEVPFNILVFGLAAGAVIQADRTKNGAAHLSVIAGECPPIALRQLAAVCEALADNLERFPS